MRDSEQSVVVTRLLDAGRITEEQVEKARQSGIHPLHDALIDLNFIAQDEVYELIAEEMGVAYVNLGSYQVDEGAASLLGEDLCRRHEVVPIYTMGDSIGLAMSDPRNVHALDQVSTLTRMQVDPFLSSSRDIKRLLDRLFQRLGSMEDMIEDLEVTRIKEVEEDAVELKDLAEEAPVTKLVNLILAQAVRDRASDVHINPEEDMLRVRFRIDGALYEIPSPPKRLRPAITSRIKVMSNLNIAETRKPQDGHIRLRIEGTDIDIRVSTLPTVHGENVVLRILNSSSVIVGLDQLGFSERNLEIFREVIFKPHGVLLNTGPTGSGKTTTLYTALQTINSMDKNIITVEDPVEYRLRLIRQVQVNSKVGLSFADGLRSILRQDPDIIMVGEIRDRETAEIAIQAALTGHFVLSTLHTNDAAGAIPRLMHMGVEPFLVAAALEAIMAQRLVRRICPNCREAYSPHPLVLKQLGLNPEHEVEFFRGAGCETCRGAGYKGRLAVFEIIQMSPALRHLAIAKAGSDAIVEQALQEGFVSLREDAIAKVLSGQTTVEEMARVTGTKVDVTARSAPVAPLPGEIVVAPGPGEIVAPETPAESLSLDDYENQITHWLARK